MSQVRAFWDPATGQEMVGTMKTMAEVINDLEAKVALLEKQVNDLQTTYMEEKLLGKEPGKIGE